MRISPPIFLFGLAVWGFGIFMFFSLSASQANLEANLRMIETGEGREITLTIDRLWKQRGSDKSYTYYASFSPGGENRWFTYNEWQLLAVGQKFKAYDVVGDIVIPELDDMQPESRWIMLGICALFGSLVWLASLIVSLLPEGTLDRDLFNWSNSRPVAADNASSRVIMKRIVPCEKHLKPLESKNVLVVQTVSSTQSASMNWVSKVDSEK